MDLYTRLLLAVTALAVLGYISWSMAVARPIPTVIFVSAPVGVRSAALITYMCRIGRTRSAPGPTKP